MLRIGKWLGAGAVLAAFACGPALADPAPDTSANMFGGLGGLREAFAKVGGTITATETSEIFANPYGGLQQGAGYDGLTTITVQIDTKTAFHIDGGTINASLFNLHGSNFNASNIGALQTLSGVEGDRATRLWELWWDQKFGENFDVRFGQQSLDVEFAVVQSSLVFVNSLFGWPALHALDMPQGGPAYPLSALGVRGRWQSGPWTALGGVFSGAPAPNTNPDPQQANPYGLSFPLNGALFIAEAQYAAGRGEGELPGVYKLGGWYNNLAFANLQYNAFGQPLADPAAAPAPQLHRGDFGFYAIADQTIWRGAEKERTLSFFVRPQFAPQGDRNLVSFALTAGLTLKDPLPGRTSDSFGLGVGFVQLSNSAIGASVDTAFFNPGVYTPRRSNETVFEATYQYQATPWAQIQPDLQYIYNVGGGIANPQAPNSKVGDALVGGLRVNVTF
jgi:porin